LTRPSTSRKTPETDVPQTLVIRCSSDWSSERRLHPGGQQKHHDEDDRAVPEAEPEADAHRLLAVCHQLAGRVVDGRDVVGVEGVAHTQGVGRDAEPDADDLATDAVLRRHDEGEEHAPPDDVQQEDEQAHAGEAAPLLTGELR